MARMKQLQGSVGPEDQGGDPGGILKQVNPADVLGAGQAEAGGFGDPGAQGQVNVPGGFDPQSGQGQETPRDRAQVGGQSGVGGNATMRRPSEPTPMAGSSFTAGSSMRSPMLPFTPLEGGSDTSSLLSPSGSGGGLLGGAGGLKGGGLGVPFEGHPGAQSQDIGGLIQMLMSKMGKGGL